MADNRANPAKPNLPGRPPLEDAPTVLSRNPLHLDSDLKQTAAAEKKNKKLAAGEPQSSTPPVSSDDRTHVSKRVPDGSGSSLTTANPLKMGQTLEGQQLGHFTLEKFVGGGGMGAVFQALDTMLGRVVAVKVLSRERTDADTLRRFKNEAQSAARLDHRNIARVHYVGEDAGWNYIVFEFIEGVNIRDMVEELGPLEIDDALNFTMQIAEALDHAAEREVVHRDIKPSNIIVTPSGRAKLVDMGLARLHQVESSNDDITASGVTLGTFDYISPEQARDPRAADVRSDIYSLGCTLYFMLCGRPPFPEGTVLQKLLSHNSDRPPDMRRYRPDLPDEVVDIVNRMLAKQPSGRYQTPADLMNELIQLAQKYQLASVSAPAEIWSETQAPVVPMWERHLPWAVPVAILIAAVFILEWGFPTAQPDVDKLRAARMVEPSGTPRQPAAVSPSIEQRPPVSPTDTDTDNGTPEEEETTSTANSVSPPLGELEPRREPAEPAEVPSNPGETVESHRMPMPVEVDPTPEESPKPTSPPRPYVISIAREDDEADDQITRRIQDALRQAGASDVVDQVELDFDGRVELTNPLFADTKILLTNAVGRQPELVFKPSEIPNTPAMIHTHGEELAIIGVRLSIDIDENLITSDGWSLIACGPESRILNISDSVLTFKNPVAYQFDDGSAFVRLTPETTETDDTTSASPLEMPPSFELKIQRCIARGEATFLRSQPGTPINVTWEQGLLATSERLLDVENMAGRGMLQPADHRVRLALHNVTAIANKGICRMGATSLVPDSTPLALDVLVSGCVVRTDPKHPLVDQVGVDPLRDKSELDMLFFWEPAGARFSGTKLVHRLAGQLQEARLRSESPSWVNPLPTQDKPWHQRTPSDYLVAGDDSVPHGFDLDQLPEIRAEEQTAPADESL